MTAKIIDGNQISAQWRIEIAQRVEMIKSRFGITPRLDVILVGDHAPSQVYVNRKTKIAKELGIESHIHRFSDQVSIVELKNLIDQLNHRPSVHGILIQLPLPPALQGGDDWHIVDLVDPRKDVDGLHYMNQGKIGLSQKDAFIACTPLGCLKMLQAMEIQIQGKHAVVIGRSRIVGRPLALLLTAHNATVTVLHSKSQNMESICQTADILLVAAGSAKMVKKSWVKPGAVVIDVGIHRIEHKITDQSQASSSFTICGDVDFDDVKEIASAISPVPGGVGPMTIAGLMHNICLSTERFALASHA
jgi:methylenetetrahydrofolate dehydrogenase (NADP+)/methenyltetrahydrofolate cyclohydrolase